ncbi:MAG: hypothetical protein ACE5Q3_02665 [Alphaproteobacteria bacterium]
MPDTNTSDTAEQPDGEAAGAEAGSRWTRRRLAFVSASVVLVALAVGGWFAVSGPAGSPTEEDEATAHETPDHEAPAGHEAQPTFVRLDPLLVQLPTSDGRRLNLALMITLEVDSKGNAKSKVQESMPFLRDALLRALTTTDLLRDTRPLVDTTALKGRVRDASTHVLGPGVVKRVLLMNISETVSG